MRNEVVGVEALEHEDLKIVVRLGLLNEGHQIADQFGPDKVHGRSRNRREQDGPFLAYLQRVEYEWHGDLYRNP